MKQELQIDIEDDSEVDEYEDFQYEMSNEMAHSFINDHIFPVVMEFDYNNPNEDYVPGVAIFGLFYKLVETLLIEGFDSDQLKEVIDEFDVTVIDSDQIH